MSFNPLTKSQIEFESDSIDIEHGIDTVQGTTHTFTVPPNYVWKVISVDAHRTESEDINIYITNGTYNHMLAVDINVNDLHWQAEQSIIIPYGWEVKIYYANSVIAGSVVSSVLINKLRDW